MVWIPLKNGSGQVVTGIKLKAPKGAVIHKGTDKVVLDESKVFTVLNNTRLGINRYKINLSGGYWTTNTAIRKTKERPGWEVVGDFYTPEELARIFKTKVDPDANKPRPQRKTFWLSKNKPGTITYKQKQRLAKER